MLQIVNGNLTVPDYSLNDKSVNVTIEDEGGGIYKINSTATSASGGNTTVECYYGASDYSSLLDNAITSNGTVCVKGDVNGSVVAEDCTAHGEGCNNTNCTELEDPIIWPSAGELSEYYWEQVEDSTSFGSDIDVSVTPSIRPGYKNGTLDIYNSGSAGKNATLNGTVYVTNNLRIGHQKGGQEFTLNLNNQTIYCEGAIYVGKKCTISGSGCIIAVGNVEFKPGRTAASEGDFIFIMSVNDTVILQPNGNFYGALAGNAEVDLQPGNTLYWTGYDEGEVNFPIGQAENKILSYTIK
jgi:hypothetical protein